MLSQSLCRLVYDGRQLDQGGGLALAPLVPETDLYELIARRRQLDPRCRPPGVSRVGVGAYVQIRGAVGHLLLKVLFSCRTYLHVRPQRKWEREYRPGDGLSVNGVVILESHKYLCGSSSSTAHRGINIRIKCIPKIA